MTQMPEERPADTTFVAAQAPGPPPWRRRRWLVLLAALLITSAAGFWAWNPFRGRPSPRIGGRTTQQWLEDLRTSDRATHILPRFASRASVLSPALREALREPGDQQFRWRVVAVLAQLALSDEEARAALYDTVRNPDPDRANAVLNGIIDGPVEVVVPLLIEALHHPSPSVRRDAAERLAGGWPIEEAIPELVRLLKEDETEVARSAAKALGHARFPTRAVIDALADAAGEWTEAVEALAALPLRGEVVPALAASLEHPAVSRRLGAVRGLKAIGGLAIWPALPGLKRVLKGDADARVRREAITVLERVGADAPDSVCADLALALVDPDEAVRRKAVSALRWLRGGRFVLEESVKSGPIAQRRSIAAALVHVDVTVGQEDLPLVLAFLGDADADLRKKAVVMLSRLRVPRGNGNGGKAVERAALPKLAAALADPMIRWDLAGILREYWGGLDHDNGAGDPYWEELQCVRDHFPKPAFENLEKGLRDKDEEKRRSAAVALVLLGQQGSEAVQLCVEKDPAWADLVGPEAREAVPALEKMEPKDPLLMARVLGRIGPSLLEERDPAVFPRLLGFVRTNHNYRARQRAVRAMADIDRKAALEVARKWTEDTGSSSDLGLEMLFQLDREQAIRLLRDRVRAGGRFAVSAAYTLCRRDPTPESYDLAMPILARAGNFWAPNLTPDALPALLRTASTTSNETGRENLIQMLASLLEKYTKIVPQVIQATGDASVSVRAVAVRALHRARLSGPDVVAALMVRSRDEDVGVRAAAESALLEAGPEALPFLAERLKTNAPGGWGLLACKDAAVPALRQTLTAENPAARQEAAEQLAGQYPRELTVGEWAGLLRDPSQKVRVAARSALLAKARDTNWGKRDAELRAAHRDILREQTQTLHHPAAWVRREACLSLAEAGDDALPALLDATRAPMIRKTAVDALTRLAWLGQHRPGLPPLIERAVREAEQAALAAAPEREKEDIRSHYARLLAQQERPEPGDAAALAHRLGQAKIGAYQREAALLALAELGPQPPDIVHAVLLAYPGERGTQAMAWRRAVKAIAPEVARELRLP